MATHQQKQGTAVTAALLLLDKVEQAARGVSHTLVMAVTPVTAVRQKRARVVQAVLEEIRLVTKLVVAVTVALRFLVHLGIQVTGALHLMDSMEAMDNQEVSFRHNQAHGSAQDSLPTSCATLSDSAAVEAVRSCAQ